jgi:hypothetical protein
MLTNKCDVAVYVLMRERHLVDDFGFEKLV